MEEDRLEELKLLTESINPCGTFTDGYIIDLAKWALEEIIELRVDIWRNDRED